VEGCKGGRRVRGGQVGRRGGSGRGAGEQIRRVEKAWHVGGERMYRDCGDERGWRARLRSRRAEGVASLLLFGVDLERIQGVDKGQEGAPDMKGS